MFTLTSDHETTLLHHFLETIVIVHTVLLVIDGAGLSIVNAHTSQTIVFRVHIGAPVIQTVAEIPCSMFMGTPPKVGVTVIDVDADTGALRVFGTPVPTAFPSERHMTPFHHLPNHSVSRERFNTVVYTMCLGVSYTTFELSALKNAFTMRTEFDGTSSITATFPAASSAPSSPAARASCSTKSLRRITPLIAMFKQVRIFIPSDGQDGLTLQCKSHDSRCEIISQHHHV
jgi:hypothetical protein